MNPQHDVNDTAAADADDWLDPRDAAGLLNDAQRAAARKLSSDKPLLSVFSALVVLATYGAIWSSSRGHHPYRGPSLDVVGLVYILVAVSALVTVSVYLRATAGVTGRSRQDARAMAIPVVVAMVGVYTFDGALKYDGFNASVVYGVFDAAAPWLVVGAVLAGYAAAKEDWWKLTGSLAMIVVATGSAFAGPANVWGVLAVGGCSLLLGQAALRFWWARSGSTGRLPLLPSRLH